MAIKKEYSQAARVQGILRTLGARQGITIGEFAEECGVTKRTLYRDLRALDEQIWDVVELLHFTNGLNCGRDVSCHGRPD